MIPTLFAKRTRRGEALELDLETRRTAHMAASLLLDYPAASRRASFSLVEAVTAQLPEGLREAFGAFFAEVAGWTQGELEAHYTATFDEKRACCPYLSYYAAGDTRRRGMALVRFVEAYRAAGWQTASGELPDHLPTVLEFSARTGSPAAAELLGAHREGVEVLRTALRKLGSPYRHVLDAVCRSLPEVDEATLERFRALIAEGPPTELVGLGSVPVALAPYSASGREEAPR